MAKLRHYQLSLQAEQVLSLSAAHEHNLFALRETSQWQDMVFYAIFMLPFAQALELVLTFVSCVYERELMQEQRMLFQQARQWRANGGIPCVMNCLSRHRRWVLITLSHAWYCRFFGAKAV